MPQSLVYVTVGNRESALAIARVLVAERLIACANIFDDATSVYRWEGEIQEARESVMVVKTTSSLVSNVKDRILELHDYDCPCVVSFEIASGNPEFLRWIEAETRRPVG